MSALCVTDPANCHFRYRHMNYKNTACAMKWIHIFEKQGLVEKVRDSIYGGRSYRQPAQYKLILNK